MLSYNGRPKKTWKAQNSGVIFTSFYLCTLMIIGLPAIFYFLSTKTFPKNCDIQDSNVELCADSVTNNVCTTDSDSDFYTAYVRHLPSPWSLSLLPLSAVIIAIITHPSGVNLTLISPLYIAFLRCHNCHYTL